MTTTEKVQKELKEAKVMIPVWYFSSAALAYASYMNTGANRIVAGIVALAIFVMITHDTVRWFKLWRLWRKWGYIIAVRDEFFKLIKS